MTSNPQHVSPRQHVSAGRAALAAAELAASFTGPIRRVRTSIFYTLALTVVAAAMIVLPLIYFAMIGAVGYGVYFYAVHNWEAFAQISDTNAKDKVGGFLIYAAPILCGAIVIFFLFKPLLARSARAVRPRALKPEDEPALFAFVAKLCEVVRAPMPRHILIDCQVNAAAGPSGGLFSILCRKLDLVIGMPLVAGLSARELTGVLAHEFGHFGQGGGMGLMTVIFSINRWFSRVVYERDAWDEFLEKASKGIDIRIAWIFWITRLCVWLSRRVLWVLMHVGHLLSMTLSRQQEYDADRYEARVVGSACFERTMLRIHLLGLAWEKTARDLNAALEEKRLGDDLPAMIVANAESFDEATRKKLYAGVMAQKSGILDTHPAPKVRIRKVRGEDAEGIFADERPAAELFSHFEESCKAVSMDFYAETLGTEVARTRLVPTRELIGRQRAVEATMNMMETYFQMCLHLARPLKLEPSDLEPAADPREAAMELKRAREQFAALAPEARKACEKFHDARQLERIAWLAGEALGAKLPFHPDGLKIKKTDEADAMHAKAIILREEAEMQLMPCEDAIRRRLRSALRLLAAPQLRQRLPEAEDLGERVAALAHVVTCHEMILEPLAELRRQQALLEFMLEKIRGNANYAKKRNVVDKVTATTRKLARQMGIVHDRMHLVAYPFAHGTGEITLGQYAMERIPNPEEIVDTYHRSEEMVDRVSKVYVRALGEMAQIAERVETCLGLPPIQSDPNGSARNANESSAS